MGLQMCIYITEFGWFHM